MRFSSGYLIEVLAAGFVPNGNLAPHDRVEVRITRGELGERRRPRVVDFHVGTVGRADREAAVQLAEEADVPAEAAAEIRRQVHLADLRNLLRVRVDRADGAGERKVRVEVVDADGQREVVGDLVRERRVHVHHLQSHPLADVLSGVLVRPPGSEAERREGADAPVKVRRERAREIEFRQGEDLLLHVHRVPLARIRVRSGERVRLGDELGADRELGPLQERDTRGVEVDRGGVVRGRSERAAEADRTRPVLEESKPRPEAGGRRQQQKSRERRKSDPSRHSHAHLLPLPPGTAGC